MNTERRKFIRNSSLITGGLVFIDPLKKLAGLTAGNAFTGTLQTVNIFHTNDLHNQLHPFTGGNRHGYGGLRNISGVLDAAKSKHILLDAGDFLDSKASPEDHSQMIQVMNQLGYHAATIGNRELARGQEYLAGLASEMKFRLVNCNYSFSNPALREQVLSSHIISWGQFRIGVTGVGPELYGSHANGIGFHHPYAAANKVAADLKQNCDLVICLSHLGYGKNQSRYNNSDFAGQSENIDLIISGHTDELVAAPKSFRNNIKEEVILSHGGYGGLIARQLTLTFNSERKKQTITCRNYVPSRTPSEPFCKGYSAVTG